MKKLLSLTLSKKLFLICLTSFIAIMLCFFNMDSTYAFGKDFHEMYYTGLSDGIPSNETINYTHKEVTEYTLATGVPAYHDYGNLQAACAPVAATQVMGYYDRYSTNLIPDFTPGYIASNGNYYYYDWSFYQPVQNTLNSLYSLMGTTPENGTTAAQLVSGINGYVAMRGYSISYVNMKTNNAIDLSKLSAAYSSGRPVLLTCLNFNIITNITDTSSTSTLLTKYDFPTLGHVMVNYGYMVYKYYRTEATLVWKPLWYNPFNFVTVYTDVNFRTDTYLEVNTGWDDYCATGYVLLNSNIYFELVYSLNIY